MSKKVTCYWEFWWFMWMVYEDDNSWDGMFSSAVSKRILRVQRCFHWLAANVTDIQQFVLNYSNIISPLLLGMFKNRRIRICFHKMKMFYDDDGFLKIIFFLELFQKRSVFVRCIFFSFAWMLLPNEKNKYQNQFKTRLTSL